MNIWYNIMQIILQYFSFLAMLNETEFNLTLFSGALLELLRLFVVPRIEVGLVTYKTSTLKITIFLVLYNSLKDNHSFKCMLYVIMYMRSLKSVISWEWGNNTMGRKLALQGFYRFNPQTPVELSKVVPGLIVEWWTH